MKYSVPFVPDKHYARFLKQHVSAISSVYFAFQSGPVLDARMRFNKVEDEDLSDLLAQLSPVKKYGLLNTRFLHPNRYQDTGFITALADRLSLFHDNGNLDGIVFTDPYLLSALSCINHPVTTRIEALPGINCMIDSAPKAFAMFDLIEETGFKLPSKIIPDRALNRDLSALSDFCHALKQRYPDMGVELLANEGCIYQCPYKLAHDAHISFSNFEGSPNKTFPMNRHFGCHAYLAKHPDRFLSSPFIRPEDVHQYGLIADSIKLCGRTLGIPFLKRCLNAYIDGSFSGNLFALMDAACWLSDHYDLDNKRLDPDFLKMVTQSNTMGDTSQACHDLWKKAATKKPFELKQYKERL